MKQSMNFLLDQQTVRLINIMEIMTLDREWIEFSDLALELKTNEKTIEKDLNIINVRWNHLFQLEYDMRKGVRFKNRTIAVMGKVMNQLFREQESLLFLELIVMRPGRGIDFYANELFISRSSLYRYISRINTAFESIGLSIQANRGKYHLCSNNELYARHFLTCFFIELHGSHGIYSFSEWLNESLLELMTKEIISKYKIEDDVQKSYYLWLLSISFSRESEGFHIYRDRELNLPVYETLVEGIQKFYSNVAEEEIKNSISTIDVQYATLSQIHLQPEFELVREIIGNLIDTFKLEISLQQIQRLIYHTVVIIMNKREYPYPTSLLFDRVYYYAYQFKKHYGKFYQAMEQELKRYNLVGGRYSDEVTDSVIYWGNLVIPTTGFSSRKIEILVISDFSRQHAQHVGRLVCDALNKVNEIATYDTLLYYDDEPLSDEKYHIILSNLPIKSQNKVILYNDYLSEVELNRIWTEINKTL